MNILIKYKFQLILFSVAFLLFANTIPNDYAWDDAIVITHNDRTQKGFAGIPELIENYKSLKLQDQYSYRPVTLVTFAVEVGIFGTNPHASHTTNALLFALCCLLLFYVLNKIFPKEGRWFCFFTTLLFAVHPIHVESVANIKSRDEILALIFSLAALSFFIDYFQAKWQNNLVQNWRTLMYFVLTFLCLLFGYWSKESAVTYFGVFPMALLYMSEMNGKKKLAYLSPLLIIPIILLLIRIKNYDMNTMFHISDVEMKESGAFMDNEMLGNALFEVKSKWQMLANSFLILLLYLKNFLFPVVLVHDYGYNQVPVTNWGDTRVILSAVFHTLALGYGMYAFFKKKVQGFAILYYFITIFIYLHLIVIAPDFMADRFLFTPSVGLCLLLIYILGWLFRVEFDSEKSFFSKNKVFAGVSIALMLLYTSRTFTRNRAWKDNVTLFETDMPNMPNCSRFHFNYAITLNNLLPSAPPEKQREMLDKTIYHYKRSYAITPQAFRSYMNLVNVFITLKQYPQAQEVLAEALKHHPEEGSAQFQMGRVLMTQNKFAEARPYLVGARKNMPRLTEIYPMLSLCYYRIGETDRAVNTALEGLDFNPTYPEFYEYLADILGSAQRYEEAIEYISTAISYDPNKREYYVKLMGLYEQAGNDEKRLETMRLIQQKFR